METRRIAVNGVELACVEQGEGPLALLLHGFPETPGMFRHLMPVLAAAGYRAVAPYMRGFAPSQVPPDGSMLVKDLIADANALHEALGGDGDAVIVGHDWGGFTTWGAAALAPERWSKVVVADVPPVRFYERRAAVPEQIHKNSHFSFFQMGVADQLVPANDFGYLDWLWRHWSGSVPGYDPAEDIRAGKEALRGQANLRAGLGLYRQNFPAAEFGTENWEMGRLLAELPTQPTLYLHGGEDPVVDEEILADIVAALPEGSDGVLLPGVGHFPLVEAPEEVNRRILDFLGK
ncbi:alpha/beta hydrolase [Streptomyces sp. AV19]|uniref:alpha/beta fold hydrolase n=1 Tax=Streptomyces sp. AV19 TaxID=2793068 RepID=UPI0018FE1855|nr:alpha/beta hydrolase [Streptomyces sp. AV19]MBH1934809.1 alpha/beta hydrolase [Streptomyces sp. AV19]MDG4530586.1 alpha/beta hydrolase [Streptomyces sp. AV19]